MGRDTGTGKQIQKSVYGKTQSEVLKKLKQIQVSIDNGSYSEPTSITVAGWMDIWLKEYLGAVKPFTVRSYSDHTKNHIKPCLGAVHLQKLTAPAVQKFYNEKLNSGLSPKTIKNLHGVLHSALKQAVLIGYLKSNPTEVCKLPRVEKKEIAVMSEDEMASLLDDIKGHKFENLYFVTLFTGMRQGEVIGLTWDCVDFKNGVILINKQLQKEKKVGGRYGLVSLKNDTFRKITPARAVMEVLVKQRKLQNEQHLKCGTIWNNKDNLVFTNELGEHLAHFTVWKHFKKIVRKLGIGHIRFHDMRHSYAVISLQSGDDVKTVQENLGHHTAAFTLDVYGGVTERMKEQSAKRMDNFINSLVV
ncbi:MAG: site-specific integrase [Lactobacillales bacterium]|nr:site-specific integrase [Lactobacillales bacterium]